MRESKSLLFCLIILLPIIITDILIYSIIDDPQFNYVNIGFSIFNFLPFVTILSPALFKDEEDFNSFFHNKILLAANLFFVIFSIFMIIGYPYVVLSYVLIMEVIFGYTSLSTLKEDQSEVISKIFSFTTCVIHIVPFFLFFGLPSGFGGVVTISFLVSWCAWMLYFARKRYFHGIPDSLRNSRPFFFWFLIFSIFYIISWPLFTEVWYAWYPWNTSTLLLLCSLEIAFFSYGALIGYYFM